MQQIHQTSKSCFANNSRCGVRKKTNDVLMFKNTPLNCPVNFVSSNLDLSVFPVPKFNMKSFFLDSSIDAKIKSLPIFILSLQREESRETFISCFYGETHPTLFENMCKRKSIFEDQVFYFNWFEHESLVPHYPYYRDEISNVFYYNEKKFLDYRVFDVTSGGAMSSRKFLYANYFHVGAFPKKRLIVKNRFYKRKFD